MIVKAWTSAKCEAIDEVEADLILMAPDDRAEALDCMKNDLEPMVSVRTKDGQWIGYPVQFVIEIKEA